MCSFSDVIVTAYHFHQKMSISHTITCVIYQMCIQHIFLILFIRVPSAIEPMAILLIIVSSHYSWATDSMQLAMLTPFFMVSIYNGWKIIVSMQISVIIPFFSSITPDDSWLIVIALIPVCNRICRTMSNPSFRRTLQCAIIRHFLVLCFSLVSIVSNRQMHCRMPNR